MLYYVYLSPCTDSQVCPVCLRFSFQVWRGMFAVTMPVSLTQSSRQELASYHLQRSQTLRQGGALKLEFSIVTLSTAIFMHMQHAAFAFLPLQKKTACLSVLLRSRIHTVAYTSLLALALNGEAGKMLSKILLTTVYIYIGYHENIIVMLSPWKIK